MKKVFLYLVLILLLVVTSVACGTPEYKVKFNSFGGSDVATQTVKEGEKAIKPENPTKEGFIFLDWYLEESVFDFETLITKDIELNAMWEEARDELTTEELKEQIAELVKSYKESLTGTINVQLLNGEDIYNVDLKYNLSAVDKIVAYEYKVNQLIGGHEIKQYTYVKDEMVYSMVSGNSGVDKLDKDATKYILKDCGISVVLDKVMPFYEDSEFFDSLSFSRKIDEANFEYVLDITKYTGFTIDITKKDSIVLRVTIIENQITFIELVSTSVDTVNKVGVGFKGLGVPNIDYPENIK